MSREYWRFMVTRDKSNVAMKCCNDTGVAKRGRRHQGEEYRRRFTAKTKFILSLRERALLLGVQFGPLFGSLVELCSIVTEDICDRGDQGVVGVGLLHEQHHFGDHCPCVCMLVDTSIVRCKSDMISE